MHVNTRPEDDHKEALNSSHPLDLHVVRPFQTPSHIPSFRSRHQRSALQRSAIMADQVMNPIQMMRSAIPRPQFFLVVFFGSFIIQYFIAGLRFSNADKSVAIDDVTRVLPSSALLVTAHPDDEAMFFSPAIQALADAGTTLSALCLSTGDAAGLGTQRAEELFASYDELGLPASRVKYLEDARLQDSMTTVWPNDHVSSVVGKHIDSLSPTNPIDALITFDKAECRSHKSHCHLQRDTRSCHRTQPPPLRPSFLGSMGKVQLGHVCCVGNYHLLR